MTKCFLAVIVAAISSVYAVGQDAPRLRVVESPRDTVFRATAEIVGATEPGSAVTVNGTPAKVYKTGTFAATIDLVQGDNAIKIVSASADGASAEKTVKCYRAEKPAQASERRQEEPTMMYAVPRYVVTGEDAYLQYGNGDDRLGGSKMGFIDSGITLAAIGSKGGLYCVRLASDRVAYIPKRLVSDASEPAVTPVNTGSWGIANTGTTDDVTISLPARLAYQYMTEDNPSAIVVDIFGATDNSNWITQRTLDLGIIDHTDFRQIGEDTYRMYIYLKDKHIWGYTVGYGDEGSTLRISVRHRPQKLALSGLVIGLDAGHGGENPGAISPSGILEKDVNPDIVMRVRDLLHKRGARTVLTRDSDTGPSMARRKQIWREGNVDIAVSVHNNAAGSYKVDGTAVLYKHAFDRDLALCVTRRLLQTGLDLFGVVGNFNFSLNAVTFCPNILVEGMFMSSPEDEERLADPDFRQQVAERIVQGLEDYLHQCR